MDTSAAVNNTAMRHHLHLCIRTSIHRLINEITRASHPNSLKKYIEFSAFIQQSAAAYNCLGNLEDLLSLAVEKDLSSALNVLLEQYATAYLKQVIISEKENNRYITCEISSYY